MKIVFGNGKILYTDSSQNDDFIILSEVVLSDVSYESPVLVRSLEELEIWFGKDFSEYKFLKRLLELGNCLYLYKPVLTDKTDIPGPYYYIPDISPQDENTYNAILPPSDGTTKTFLNTESLIPPEGEEGVIYKIILRNGIKYDAELNIRYSYFMYSPEEGEYVPWVDKIEPKNLSLENRDYLQVKETDIYTYSRESVNGDLSPLSSDPDDESEEVSLVEIQERLEKGYSGRTLLIEFPESPISPSESKFSYYFCVPRDNCNYYFVYGDSLDSLGN